MLINDLNIFGNKLCTIRKNSGLTQTQVAEAAEVSNKTYANIERGVTNPTYDTLIKICNALKITPNDLATEETINIAEKEQEVLEMIELCTPRQKESALDILLVYLKSEFISALSKTKGENNKMY